MKTGRIRPLFTYHGGKYYLAPWIISYFPEHSTYVEPFCGGCNVFLQKDPVPSYLNDLNFDTYNLLDVANRYPRSLQTDLTGLEYNEATFKEWQEKVCTDSLGRAVKEYVLRRMSRGSTGKSFAWQNRLRGGKPGSINSWETSITNILPVSQKLSWATLSNLSYEEMSKYDSPDTLFYLDPPYLKETRVSKKVYSCEMTTTDHEKMLDWALSLKGKVVISGYNYPIYHNKLKWRYEHKFIKNNSSQQKSKPTMMECLWLNF